MLSLGILLVVETEHLASVLRWFGARWWDWKLVDVIQNLSLSLSLSLVFSFFSLFAGILIDSGSRGLKAKRGVAVVSRGVHETRRSSFFSFFLFLFLFFPGRYNFTQKY